MFASRCHAGQVDFESGSAAQLAEDPDVAATLLDDSVDPGKPEPGAFCAFGGEEGFEDVGLSFYVHAHAGVADSQHHVFARLKGRVNAGVFVVEGDVGGLDCEFSAGGHGVAGIDGEVHDDLLDLAGIGAHRAETRARHHDQVDVFANHAVEHFQVFGDDAVEIENARSQHLLAAEGEQLAGKGRGPSGGAGNLLSRSSHLGVRTQAVQ